MKFGKKLEKFVKGMEKTAELCGRMFFMSNNKF